MQSKSVAIIAGYGSLPVIALKNLKSNGYKVTIIALKESCNHIEELSSLSDALYTFSVGQAGKIIKSLKKEGATELLLSGKVEINLLHKTRFDLKAIIILARIAFKSTDSINLGVIAELERHGISVMSQKEAYSSLLCPEGVLTLRKPTEADSENIKIGLDYARHIGKFDLGQSIVIEEGNILAIETAEGTDKTFARGLKLSKTGNPICCKVSKPNQDERFDLPTIGLDTLKNINEHGGKIIAIQANETLIVDKEACIKYANENGIVIVSTN